MIQSVLTGLLLGASIYLGIGLVVWIRALAGTYPPPNKPWQDDSAGLGFVLVLLFGPVIVLCWPLPVLAKLMQKPGGG